MISESLPDSHQRVDVSEVDMHASQYDERVDHRDDVVGCPGEEKHLRGVLDGLIVSSRDYLLVREEGVRLGAIAIRVVGQRHQVDELVAEYAYGLGVAGFVGRAQLLDRRLDASIKLALHQPGTMNRDTRRQRGTLNTPEFLTRVEVPVEDFYG